MFTTILVAYDGSAHAEAAIAAACDLAKVHDAALHIVHAPELYDQAIAVGASAVTIPVTREQILERGQPVIDKAVSLAKGCDVTPAATEVLHGPVAEVILEYASTHGVDLIVSGRRGLGSLRGLLLGSVSTKLAALADCAVLTVK